MNPQDPTQTGQSGQAQLDPSVVALMRAVAKHESGNKYQTPTGKDGEQGAYQMTPGFISAHAPKYLAPGSYDPNNLDPVSQDKLAYGVMKEWGSSGLNAAQVASKWNSGNPNAYKQNHVGTSPGGAAYDTPRYVANVTKDFNSNIDQNQQSHTNSSQTDNGLGAFTPQTSPDQTKASPPPPPPPPAQSGNGNSMSNEGPGFLSSIDSFANKALSTILPIVPDIANRIKGVKDNKTGLQLAGDLGTSALTAIAGIGMLPEAALGAGAGLVGTLTGASAETALGRIGTQAAFGGAMGLTGALGSGQTDPGKIAQSTAIGGVTGGVVGGASELISKAAQYLPQRIVRSFLPKINQDTAQYAVEKGLGSPAKMLVDSNASLSSLGKELGTALSKPEYAGITATAEDILPKIIQQFPNAGLTNESVGAALMKVAPLQKTLIEKLATGEGLSLDELHTLNSALGENTFKMAFDDPVVRAGKKLASAFYHTSSDFIKSAAPETAPLFDQFSKEIPLNTALQRAIRSGQKAKIFTLRNIVELMAGFATAGPLGAGGVLATDKILSNPTVNLKAAGLISKFGSPIAKKLATPVTGLVSRYLTK
jgi:hypothetical protein